MRRRDFLVGMAAGAGLGLASAAQAAPEAVKGEGRLRIAHLTDPQLGFGKDGKTQEAKYLADMLRFERAVERVNALKPDLALLTGDMTHRIEDIARDWPRLIKLFKVPVAVAPGNHDTGKSITKENLDRYRSIFGYDRKAFDLKGWRIIVGNTQFLFATELKEEQSEYNAWVKRELETAKKYDGRVILAGHCPPFADNWKERDCYYNFNGRLRGDRMRMYRQAGANFFLAGHTHRFGIRGYRNLTILNAEVTSRSFDERPFGFRMFEIDDDMNYVYNFVRV